MQNYQDYVKNQAKRQTETKKEVEDKSFSTEGMMFLRPRSYKPIIIKKEGSRFLLGIFYKFTDKSGAPVETIGKNAIQLTKQEIQELAQFAEVL
jgi:hypothetical protein